MIAYLLFVATALSASPKVCEVQHTIPSMGTLLKLQYLDSCDKKNDHEHALETKRILDRLENSMSLYQSQSEISQLNKNGVLKKPSQDILSVVQLSLKSGDLTEGYFDISIWPVLAFIKDHFAKSDSASKDQDVDGFRERVDYKKIVATDSEVKFATKGMMITLDGIAKGYAVDLIADVLKSRGIKSFLIDFSGNMMAHGRNTRGRVWTVAVESDSAKPEVVSLDNEAISTSGSRYATYSEKNKWHHLLNPKTLRPVNTVKSVTVVGPSAAVCDMLTTAVFVMDSGTASRIIKKNYPSYRLVGF